MAGYSGTSLVKKLGYKAGFKVLLYHVPDNYFSLLGDLPCGITFTDETANELDLIHIFVKEKELLLDKLPFIKSKLSKKGMVWISWPKKSSKVPTEIDEAFVRENGIGVGLVDIKICAVDEIWSGLKFVYRKNDR